MPPANQHKEEKVQRALKLLYENPSIKIATAVQQTRTIYDRVRCQLKGILRSSAREGYNKKLNVPLTAALKDYLIICYLIGRSCSIDATVAVANSILRYNSKEETAHCQ
jgi:hypothetical protein